MSSPRARTSSRVAYPVAQPAIRRTAIQAPTLVNWRMVGAAGAVSWLGVMCLVAGIWMVRTFAAEQPVAFSTKKLSVNEPPVKTMPIDSPIVALNRVPAVEPAPERKAAPLVTKSVGPVDHRATAIFSKATPAPRANPGKLAAAEAAVADQVVGLPEAPVARAFEDAPAAPRPPEKVARCGTAVDFLNDPSQAMAKASADNKLVFVVHVAGDFEDPGFT